MCFGHSKNPIGSEAKLEIGDEMCFQYFNYYLKKSGSPKRCSLDISADYSDSLELVNIGLLKEIV
jgi:hypothetical protein